MFFLRAPLVSIWFLAAVVSGLLEKGAHREAHLGKETEEDVSFLKLNTEALADAASNYAGPLYVVNINFAWQTYDWSKGATVVIDTTTRTLRMDAGLDVEKGVVWGYMEDNLNKNGWIELHLETTENSRVNNDIKMYAAGYMEGLMTSARMSQFFSNFYQLAVKDEATKGAYTNVRGMFTDVIKFVQKNSNLAHSGALSVAPADPYWKHARYCFIQVWGMKEGYNQAALEKSVRALDMIDMMVINSHAELPELMQAYKPEAIASRKRFQSQLQNVFAQTGKKPKHAPVVTAHHSPEATPAAPALNTGLLSKSRRAGSLENMRKIGIKNETEYLADRDWENRVAKDGHCSALVRLATENKDLFVGHTTGNDYSKMTRIWKHYIFHLPGSWQAASYISFSSYPGCVSSTDDYYMMNSGLVVMDTSLEILNPKLFDRIPEFPANSHIPNFMHTMVVNRIAKSGNHWTTLFSERNSGTNNAQWIIVNYNRFTPEKTVPDNTIWLLEQVPGIMKTQDISGILRSKGYWASYNRPYFPEVRQMSGHDGAQTAYGALYSFDGGPRATIFKRIAPAVENLFDMRSVMSRNHSPSEGVLPNEPGHAISARMDLDSVSHIPNGGIDAKVTNRCLFRSLQSQAVSGPTHFGQKVFKWVDAGREVFPGWPHLGLPDAWDFRWVQVTPTRMSEKIVDKVC